MEVKSKTGISVETGVAQTDRYMNDKSVPPRAMEGMDDFTTRATKRMACVQDKTVNLGQNQDLDQNY